MAVSLMLPTSGMCSYVIGVVYAVPMFQINIVPFIYCGLGISVGTANGYGLDGSGIKCRCGRDFPHLSRPAPASCTMDAGSFPGVKSGWGDMLIPHPLLVSWSRKSRAIPLLPLWAVWSVQSLSACTVQLYLYSPQCLYSTAIPLLPLWAIRPVQSHSACTVHLYLYSPYGPYGLYRASVPVQYSYTSTPPMGRTASTEPQCLYSIAIPLLPLWAVRPVQSLSACTKAHFYL